VDDRRSKTDIPEGTVPRSRGGITGTTMQSKLGAGFILVAFLYLLVGLSVPRLQFPAIASTMLTASLYLVIGLGVAWLLSRKINRRLSHLARIAALVRDGDLTQTVPVDGDDEIAELGHTLQVMSDSLRKIVVEVQDTSSQINDSTVRLLHSSESVTRATNDIAHSTAMIAHGAEEQATQVTKTSEATRSWADVAGEMAEHAEQVHRMAREANRRASRGRTDAQVAAKGIEDWKTRNLAAVEAMESLRGQASEIGSLIGSVTSISHQTQLLAINAAIEAARAGEGGRGFAVVADEVSQLSDSVRHFAKQISKISHEITDRARTLGDQIRDTAQSSEMVVTRLDDSLASFGEILESVEGTETQASRINDASEKQRTSAGQVVGALQSISEIADRNYRGSEETSVATQGQTQSVQTMYDSVRGLADTSQTLRDLVSVFKIGPR